MIRYLYLVRHGEALPDTTDPRRPLSPQGREEVTRCARFLKAAAVQVPRFYHSGKLRAEETARILRDTINPKGVIEKKESLGPNDPVAPILKEISKASTDLLIAGHMPSLALVATALLTGDPDADVPLLTLSTGGVAILEREGERWFLRGLIDPGMI